MSTFVSYATAISSRKDFVCGHSDAIQAVHAVVEDIARTDIPVLLNGESGTGKEVYARLIHRISLLGHLPFKKFSCTTFEPSQFLAQLQEFVRIQGDGHGEAPGTIFLDRIDELDLGCQKLLLSWLPDEEAAEGGKRVRVISSASQDLDKEIASGRFRKELYFRINGVCVRLPPLRKRTNDIPALIEHFLAKYAYTLREETPQLNKEEINLLITHDWPGNVRELANLVRKIVALGDPKTVIGDLREAQAQPALHEELPSPSLKVVARAASRQAERELILKALECTHWNRKRAAQQLQISYKSLLYKIKLTGVERAKDGY